MLYTENLHPETDSETDSDSEERARMRNRVDLMAIADPEEGCVREFKSEQIQIRKLVNSALRESIETHAAIPKH